PRGLPGRAFGLLRPRCRGGQTAPRSSLYEKRRTLKPMRGARRIDSARPPSKYLWRMLAAGVVSLLWVLSSWSGSSAHPLGNFTVNRYSRIEVSEAGVRVRYVLDLAEIPTFQAMTQLDGDRDGVVSDREREAYAAARMSEIARRLVL